MPEKAKRQPTTETKGLVIRPSFNVGSYERFAQGIQKLLSEARRQAARSVNAILTATYWEIGRRIVEFEQAGRERAVYGEALLERL